MINKDNHKLSLTMLWFNPLMLGIEVDWDFKKYKYFSYSLKLLLFRIDYYIEWD